MAEVNFEEQLIDMVKENEVLYNEKHPKYKNNALKHKIWNHISTSLGESAILCQNRWKLIKRRHYNELRNETNTVTGAKRPRKTRTYTRDLSFLLHTLDDSCLCKNISKIEDGLESTSKHSACKLESENIDQNEDGKLDSQLNKAIFNISNSILNNKAEDSSYYFSMSLVEILRGMHPIKRAKVEYEIMKVIVENND